jgi:hypothetical protein
MVVLWVYATATGAGCVCRSAEVTQEGYKLVKLGAMAFVAALGLTVLTPPGFRLWAAAITLVVAACSAYLAWER